MTKSTTESEPTGKEETTEAIKSHSSKAISFDMFDLTNEQIAERQTLAQIIKNHSSSAVSNEIIYAAAENVIRQLEILTSNIKSKPIEKPFKCDICVFSTNFQVNLMNHKRTHTEKSFRCDLCEYTSTFKVNLENHKKSAHADAGDSDVYNSDDNSDSDEEEDSDSFNDSVGDYKRKYTVTRRSKVDNNNEELTALKVGDKPWKCDQCPYSTNYKSALKDHKRAHDGYRPFKCSKCDYAAVNKSNLTKHFRIHSGEKPFKCNLCSYSAAQKGTLKNHKRNHHGIESEESDCDTIDSEKDGK